MKMMQLQFGCRKPSAKRGGLARRLSALAMSLLLVCSLPLAAFAGEYDLAQGSVSIEARSDGQYVTHGSSSEVQDSAPVITGTTNFHSVTITAAADTTANVTLSGVNMNTIGAAIQTTGDGNVTIELDGTNTVKSGYTHAGVEKNNGGNLTITDGNETAGNLTATGGSFGAGIGGGYGDSGENITVTGSAQVTANGGTSAAGIGGGGGDNASVAGGSGSNIKISGDAVVEANGGDGIPYSGGTRSDLGAGAGIGGGGSLTVSGDGTGITITGNAHVTANGGSSYNRVNNSFQNDGGGAGIGGGGGGKFNNEDSDGGSGIGIEISGESTVVTANGGVQAAGIGGGDGGSGSGITIGGSAQVGAHSGMNGAGIGGGRDGSGSDITITDNAEVEAYGGMNGAGIGGGLKGSGSDITITDNAEVKATGNGEGAGIGGGQEGNGSDIAIGGSAIVDAHGRNNGAGIGGGQWGSGSGIAITDNAKVTAYSDKRGAGIGGGYEGSGSDIKIGGSAKVDAHSGINGAGIGGGFCGSGSGITVSGDAQVKAQGGVSFKDETEAFGAGAAIGDGGGDAYDFDADFDVSTVAGAEAALTTVAPQAGNSYGLYAGALAGGWIAKYAPGTDRNGTPNSLTYKDASGEVQIATKNIELEAAQSATCTQDGHEAGFSIDGALVALTIPHTGHSFTNYISNNDGSKTVKCDNCDATDTIPAPGSKLVKPDQSAPLYWVTGQDGKGVACKTEQKDGVLTITVDADSASLTGYLWGLQALQAQGIDTIVFVTNGATSTFALSDLMATMTAGDSYTLTHDGSTTTFTLGTGTDISSILK